MARIEQLQFGRKTAKISNRMNSILSTMDECIKEKRLYPTLILIYSSIDILGSLQSPKGFANKKFFTRWIKKYLFKAKKFPCNANDLYGARCGILHTLRYESKDTTLKEIVYGFYGYDKDIMDIKDPAKQAGIYIEDLCEAFISGYGVYIQQLESSTDSVVNTNINKLPNYVDLIPLD